MNTTIEKEKEILRELCTNCTMIWININLNPRKIIDHVEAYVVLAAVLMIVIAIGAPRRRQSQSIIIRYGVEGAFVLSLPLLSYTLGLMQGQVIKNVLYPVWAMFLVMLLGGTYSMSARKLEDNKQLLKLFCDKILFGTYIGALLATFNIVGKELPCNIAVLAVICLLVIRSLEELISAQLPSNPSSDNGIPGLAKYMKLEHQLSQSWDPRTMQGYKYVVLIHMEKDEIGESAITLEKIWCDNIGVLSSSESPICRLKDLCLSFALFHLLIRRYFGYTCHESNLDKTRDLVLHGLLEQDCERAFQVIEAELAFVYDFFFTKYAFIMYGHEVWCFGLSLACAFTIIAVGQWALNVLNTSIPMEYNLIEMSTRDVTVTKVLLGVFAIFQLMEIWSYCVSDWGKVSLVCKYVRYPSWQGNTHLKKLISYLGRPNRCLRYWRNTIGQYSVLDSFLVGPCGYWDRLKLYFSASGRIAGKEAELPKEVKRAVARTIKMSINGHLSNGASALMKHSMSDELCWACQIGGEFTLTHSILVWHIATTYCEISEMVRREDENNVHPHKVVASSLSKYCAYLVGFAPTLLSGSHVETELTLKELEEELKGALQNLISPEEKYNKLKQLHNMSRETMPAQLSTLTKGVMLGEALESLLNGKILWGLLADFWAEMMVYIAPSGNVAGHIELLAEGGEFVTHVWALLMHAGILDRPATATAVP